jgi:uncharacterized protein
MTETFLDKKIIRFFEKHHVLTLASVVNDDPWCANCFYVYNSDVNSLIFTSDNDTKHIQYAVKNPKVAGSVVLETSVIGKIQGIQFSGILVKAKGNDLKTAKEKYLKRFPIATLMNTNLWILNLTYIKMTDNRLGFGKKLIWKMV